MSEIVSITSIQERKLDDEGFTQSGKDRYIKTVLDYSVTLLDRSIKNGEIDKAEIREITHDHVKAAAHSMANSFGKNLPPKWLPVVRIAQYLCAAGVGVAGNHLDKGIGVFGFIIAFCVGTILVYIENLYSK